MENRGETYLLLATHSGPRPADFPFGSLESRVAVRRLLTPGGGSYSRKARARVLTETWSCFAIGRNPIPSPCSL